MLNNALQQTGWKDKPLSKDNWRAAVHERLLRIQWQDVLNDVRPFLEPGVDPTLLTQENLQQVLERQGR